MFEYNGNYEKCSYCGEEIAVNTRRCPYCGSLLEIRSNRIKVDTIMGTDSAGVEFNEAEVSHSQNNYESVPLEKEDNAGIIGAGKNNYVPNFQLVNYVKPERKKTNAESQTFYSTVDNSKPAETASDKNLSNGLKVFLTIFCTILPGLGQLVGVITGAIFLASEDADKRSFGRALLIASLIFFVISFFVFFAIIVLLSSIAEYL
ncbi:MAG TPA: zinc ribbon domain-containing protein [Clostridiaceae bacterium]|nr:zinc ribbon domain-containing protein [Clostridiaceae bacterium]